MEVQTLEIMSSEALPQQLVDMRRAQVLKKQDLTCVMNLNQPLLTQTA